MTEVRIPKMGMSTVEVDIVAVHVAPGDRVEADSIVVEVQSEKANFEVEAGAAGTVTEVLVEAGDEAKVGAWTWAPGSCCPQRQQAPAEGSPTPWQQTHVCASWWNVLCARVPWHGFSAAQRRRREAY